MISRRLEKPVIRDRNFFLELLSKASSLTHLTKIHAQIILSGLHTTDVVTITKLTHRLADLSAISHARKLVFSFPKPDRFLFNVLVRASASSVPSAISIFSHLRTNTPFQPDNFTYTFAFRALGASSSPSRIAERFARLLHSQSIIDGYISELAVGSAAVDMYFKISKVSIAWKVFDGIPDPDIVMWNTLISGLTRNCCYEESIEVFHDAIMKGAKVDSTTVSSILPAAAEVMDLNLGTKIHGFSLKSGFLSNPKAHVLTGLVSLYSKSRELSMAEMAFQEIRRPDVVSHNAMISGYCNNNRIASSVSVFRDFLSSGWKANSNTMVSLIPLLSPFGHFNYIRCLQSFCVKSGFISDVSVSSAFTTSYSRIDEIELARQIFNETPIQSLGSWNAMISAYVKNGLTETAISLFREMQSAKISPNPITISTILSACAHLGTLSLGKWVHNLIKASNFDSNRFVSTALIDMYSKCGSILDAVHVFHEMPVKNVVTCNAMITGFGLHGFGKKAINLYNQMLQSGISPDHVTFLSILHACSHAGLISDGETIFHSMISDHRITPSEQHYACMVDLFGRSGQVDRAYKFIKSMPFEPGLPVWGTFLGACKTHKNTELARIASARLFELDHEKSAGYFVLLSNMYSEDRNYPKAAMVREFVDAKNLKKPPGCTLLEIGDTPHVFKSGDWSHPQGAEIRAMLENLMGKMKEAGFCVETNTALRDLEEEEKEEIVSFHSEKLAIAYGLIALEKGAEIRIFKNLRVCGDCHNATKFISKITQRVIVVRDANRFHHFKDGVCSCGDYW